MNRVGILSHHQAISPASVLSFQALPSLSHINGRAMLLRSMHAFEITGLISWSSRRNSRPRAGFRVRSPATSAANSLAAPINPLDPYHNQVTREQGAFSLRMFHCSWMRMMIRRNIFAPGTLLGLPTLERFKRELTS